MEIDSKETIEIKYRIYRILVGLFVGVSLSCSHQTNHWLLSLFSNENEEQGNQSFVYYLLEALFFFTVAPFAIVSNNVLIISACLILQFVFYLVVTTSLNFFTSNTVFQYALTTLFALSRSILFGRLLVMMKNWFSERKLVLCVGLTYFLNEFFSIFSSYWDASNSSQDSYNSMKDRILFISLLLSSLLGLIIQGKPEMMGLKEEKKEDEDDEIDEEEMRDVMPNKGGIISSLWGIQHSLVRQILRDSSGEFNFSGKGRFSIWMQFLKINKIIFFILSSVCLNLLNWYTQNQVQGALLPYQQNQDFYNYIFVFGLYGVGGLAGTILLGFLLDVYNKDFTLRLSVLSLIGLSFSYLFSLLYYYDFIPDILFVIAVGFFELSFYCTYQVGVPIVLIFDLMRYDYGDISFIIIPLFSGLDRIVNAFFDLLNSNQNAWTVSSTIMQPICICAMFLSLLIQYYKQVTAIQKHSKLPESNIHFRSSLDSVLIESKKSSFSVNGDQSNKNVKDVIPQSRNGTQNFRISISSDAEDESSEVPLENQSHTSSFEQGTKFKFDKKFRNQSQKQENYLD